MKEWVCIWCGRKVGEDRVLHTCKGTLRKRNRFTFYIGDDPVLQEKNFLDYEKFKERNKKNEDKIYKHNRDR